ncbi:hypothetical protein [Natronomonas amylolytica]|uniref:hypothetical protein n=1 Tax=Natronomonas amylolytica TaxID=3108498 RepID=UPI0030096D08
MASGDHERGQSVLIGSILLFGILVIAFAGYQAVAVPNQNSDVEFEHFQDVEGQFTGLHSNIVNAVESDEERSVRLDLGMRYPPRLIALNPPPVDGQLRTTEAREVTIRGSSGEITADVCGADATSRSLIYSPGYNEFQNAQSITYENTFATRTYRDGAIYGDQQLVRGNEIGLTLLNGSVSKSETGAYSLNINGSHRYQKPGEVTDPTITIPTRFSAGVWNSQIINDRSDVTATPNGSNHVDLSFSGDYRISCAVAGLDSDPAFTPPGSLTDEGGNTTYDVRWDTSKIIDENEAVRSSANADIEVDSGATVDSPGFFVDVTDRNSGAPINDIVIDAGHSGSIVSSIDDSNAVTGASGAPDGETPGFKIVFESNDDRGTLYAGSADNVDTITVNLVSATFESLQGSSSTQGGGNGGGQSRPATATFDFTLTSSANVTFNVTEANGNSAEETLTNEQSGSSTLNIQGTGNNAYPLELRANIANGECLQTTLDNSSETATLSNDDWNEC